MNDERHARLQFHPATAERMWSGYREGSAVARARVKDGRVLRIIGFGQTHRAQPATIDATIDGDPVGA